MEVQVGHFRFTNGFEDEFLRCHGELRKCVDDLHKLIAVIPLQKQVIQAC